jgi:glutaminase
MKPVILSRREVAAGAVALGFAGAAGTGRAAVNPTVSSATDRDAVLSAYRKYRTLDEGSNFPLPVFEKVSPGYFGIALVPVGRAMATAGDIEQTFAIQSVSKVFTLALVLQESGPDAVEDNIGVDATGRPFDSIEAIEAHKGHDMNPMVSPGAIATVGMVKGSSKDEIWAKILGIQSAFAGRALTINEEVYDAAIRLNQRGKAMSILMSAYKRFDGDPAVVTDLYSRQCALNVSARDLGVMAATLASGGRNPITGKRVVDSTHVPKILAVMATAGMYDRSGRWLFHTGLPAKSGVGGGIIAVAPGRFGIGTFSPRLDVAGNSVRGQKAIADISAALHGNPFAPDGA